ncbi:alpha-L-fucosidase [candidate division KSB1 bacterium]|nr:alpha-L-fucosidase [candidate division KSB1 bacterium]
MNLILFAIGSLLVTIFLAEVFAHPSDQKYYPEVDPLAQEKINRWQDLKFGLLMHWGPYSQWGVVESWSICAEDEPWCTRRNENYIEYKKQYENLKTTFNPVNFNPEKWALVAKNAGMRYVVFTTKHHDGFCLFDSKYTDYKITDKACPFHTHPQANITRAIFESFRQKGFWIGTYFSKPDWHSEYYWWPNFATPDRNVNYDIKKHPARWQKFIEFTHNQILELMTDYGAIDILWMDGGWVQPLSHEEIQKSINSPDYTFTRIQSQDIKMAELVKKAREKQPGLIVVDRAVEGPFQNYLTPENQVPERRLPYPWESCIIAGGGWSYVPNAKYKSARELIHVLVDIVSKGGNLLLNIAPGPDGTWHEDAYSRLAEIGEWLKINADAIYNSRPIAPYKEGKVCLTHQKDGSTYAIYLAGKDEKNPPSKIWLSTIQPEKDSKVTMLGTKEELQWETVGRGFVVNIPESIQQNPPCQSAWTLKFFYQ